MAIIGHFPPDFGQGTGLSVGHVGFAAELNQMIAGGHPEVPLAHRVFDKAVYVDPVNGSDDPANDGTKTPLKSLAALAKRMPESMSDETASAYFGRSIVKLLPGEHHLTDDLGLIIPQNVKLEGSFGEVESFVVDSLDANKIDLYKSVATPAWTPGAFKEMFIGVDYFGLITILIPIIDSGDHWIRMAWDYNFISSSVPSPGDTVNIVDLTSVIKGNGNKIDLALGAGAIVGDIDFDGVSYVQATGSFGSFNSCRFSNGVYGLLDVGGYKVASQCIFRDMSYSATSLGHMTSEAIRGSLFARCPRAFEAGWGATLSFIYEVSFFVDCPTVIQGGRPGLHIQHEVDDLYCDGVTDFLKVNSGGADIVFLSALTAAIDSKLPTNLVTAKNGCRVSIHAGSTLEAATNSLNINGVISTMANFFAGGGHNGWWEDQNGNRVFART